MDLLIKQVLEQIFPETAEVQIIFESCSGDASGHGSTEIESLIRRRVRGESKAALLLGFDSAEKVRLRKSGSILDAPGVFFLKLPSSLAQIEALLARAIEISISKESGIDETNLRRHAIQRVRTFKHTCDNVWMAMKANANRARRLLKTDASRIPAIIGEIKQSRMERLLEECHQIEPLARHLGLKHADRLGAMMDEAVNACIATHRGSMPPECLVDQAFECTAKIQSISDILAAAKELPEND